MENNFDDIKNLWQSGDHQVIDFEMVKEEISQLRKVEKDKMILWYFLMIFKNGKLQKNFMKLSPLLSP